MLMQLFKGILIESQLFFKIFISRLCVCVCVLDEKLNSELNYQAQIFKLSLSELITIHLIL